MKLARVLLPLVSFCILPTLSAQAPAEASHDDPLIDPNLVTQIKYEGLENSQVMAYLDYLTNTIGHRLTGSENFDKACLWAKGEFEKMGLDVELEHWATWPFGSAPRMSLPKQ